MPLSPLNDEQQKKRSRSMRNSFRIVATSRKGGGAREFEIDQFTQIRVELNMVYRLVDRQTGASVKRLILRKKGESLEVLVAEDQEFQAPALLAELQGFYSAEADAAVDVSEVCAPGSPAHAEVTKYTPVDPGSQLVWDGGQLSCFLPVFEPTLSGALPPVFLGGGALTAHGLLDRSRVPTDLADPDTVAVKQKTLTVVPVAGPFSADALEVRVFKANGQALRASVEAKSDGSYSLKLDEDYIGPVLVVLFNKDTSVIDFVDEATGALKDLGTQALRAIDFLPNSDHTVYVTPLTELAVRLAGIGLDGRVSAVDLIYNDQVADMFGLETITGPVVTVLDASFSENAAAGQDGVNEAEKYGKVLAALSGADSATGSLTETLARLQDGIVNLGDAAQPTLVFHHSAI